MLQVFAGGLVKPMLMEMVFVMTMAVMIAMASTMLVVFAMARAPFMIVDVPTSFPVNVIARAVFLMTRAIAKLS